MTTLESTIDTYLNAWTEHDPARRAQLIEEAWAPDGQLVDPPLWARGRGEISDMASALQGQFPGHYFRRSSEIDEHHSRFRFAWELVSIDGAVALAGVDVGQLDGKGQIDQITGFFGELLPANAKMG
jgi:hypothetical protein